MRVDPFYVVNLSGSLDQSQASQEQLTEELSSGLRVTAIGDDPVAAAQNVQVLNSSGTVLATLATYSNLNAATGYVVHTANLAAYIGQTVTIKFTGKEDTSLQTSFVLDDVTLTVQ